MQNEKLIKLRKLMADNKVDSYLVRSTDAHNSEYIAACDQRLRFLTGFSGSNGLAYITQQEALMWTDSRYFIQAEKQLESGWQMKKQEMGAQRWFEFIKEHSALKTRVGFNPLLVNFAIYNILTAAWKEKEMELIEIENDLVDEVWGKEKPSMPKDKVFIHELEFCGASLEEKINMLGEKLKVHKVKQFFTSALDEIAWVLNLRCNDIDYNPFFFSNLIVEFKENNEFKGTLYVLMEKIPANVDEYLKKNYFEIKDYFEVFSDLKQIKEKIAVDYNSCSFKVISTISKDLIVDFPSPLELMKAIKNKREQQGMIECHIRDGVGLVAYLAWLEDQIVVKKNTKLNEYDASLKVKEFREMQKWNKGLAFKTISSIGPNGAIVHYQASETGSALLNYKQVYLLDSGTQYLDGTTDVTRTLHFGASTAEEKNAYTLVLLGNLDIERTIWPRDSQINGSDIDVLARRRLWQNHLDYGHGTGHGVGYFLGVHEGPCGISKKSYQNFIEGMVVSNEPGYYKENYFGIRIENCLIVVNDETDPTYQKFLNLTLCPYDRKLIDFTLLHKEDIEYINKYHQRVLEVLTPLLKEQGFTQALEWLIKETKPL